MPEGGPPVGASAVFGPQGAASKASRVVIKRLDRMPADPQEVGQAQVRFEF